MHVSAFFKIEGKIALVTGGSVGLGEQMATALAEAGANVALSARKVERCEATAEKIRKVYGVKALALKCNVAEEQDVRAMTDAVLRECGRIDILINNAGTDSGGAAVDYPFKGWNKVRSVNVTGTFFCCQQAWRAMIAQGGGKIINIASVAGMLGFEP